MTLRYNRWITFTPKAFRGDERTFFSRDSGLCCRALQSLGAQANVVMPEPAWDDEPDVLRVPCERLSDPAFWRQRKVDAVISYSWGYPCYTAIVRAIKQSGVRLFLNMDTTGIISPFGGFPEYVRAGWENDRVSRGVFFSAMMLALRLGWQLVGLPRHWMRLRHMSCADAIGVVSPIAAERIRKYARFFGRQDIAQKVQYVPHPVNPVMCYSGVSKQKTVIAVGRWDDSRQKRPEMLTAVAKNVLREDRDVRFVIIGKGALLCVAEILSAVPDAGARVVGYERLEHDRLCEQMNQAQISLCTSRYESFHIASGEALLCGCSVVAPQTVQMPSFPYFTDEGRSGRLSADTVASLTEAVLDELAAWKTGGRDPEAIARTWRTRIGAQAVVQRIDELLSD